MRRVAGEKIPRSSAHPLLLVILLRNATSGRSGCRERARALVPVTIMLLLFGEGLIYMLATAASIPRTEAWSRPSQGDIDNASDNDARPLRDSYRQYNDEDAHWRGHVHRRWREVLDEERDDMIALHGILTHDVFVLTKITGFQYDISFASVQYRRSNQRRRRRGKRT